MEFTEVAPGDGCACRGCGARRLARLHAARAEDGGHPSARGARRAAVLLAAVGTVLGGAAAAGAAPSPAPGDSPGTSIPDTPQGEVSGLYGGESLGTRLRAAAPATTRSEIIARARLWTDQHVPYSMTSFWTDGYRQDCSGFVSMAWGLGGSQTTWTLPDFADRISRDELQPGDVLIYNNAADPAGGSHAVLFGGWTDSSRTRYTAYEQTRPSTLTRATPYAYWSNSGSYLPYRYRGLDTPAPAPAPAPAPTPTPAPVPVPADPDAFPGTGAFGPGTSGPAVQRLGEMLVQRGGARFYSVGPGPQWGEADRRATEAFQLAQGWRGAEADGYPGKDTWEHLVKGRGQDIPPAATPAPAPAPAPMPAPPPSVPPFPGTAVFGPGQVNTYVTQLGQQLVRKGFGRYYTQGPGPGWGEADRLNVQAFQQAQGWRGTEADGYPGPDTWKRLFG
ncbi:peptidoglycan-binding protein [Kitasatospora sp. NPDC088346]|uniref:peptidoglycan-binding protein n=1 Tax=Kitasatospora sp. NPDC088346 TaxID=3364073 RepID=UPI003825ED51